MNTHPHQHRPVDPKTGRLYRIVSSPPPALRKATLDNLALLPASLLPFKAEYQAIANHQTPGTILVLLPSANTRSRHTLEQVAAELEAKGQLVQVLTKEELRAATP